MKVGWLDLSSGVSGDMLLGACLDAGVPLEVVHGAVDRLDLPERVTITPTPVLRSDLGATHAVVEVAESHHHRRLPDVLALLERLDSPVRERAAAVFRALAEAEARVHRADVDEVHFHEVGALDSLADVVGAVAGLHHLGLDRLVASPVALGGGRTRAAHGSIPVPPPAVVELLRAHAVPGYGGPLDVELATPTGVAIVATLADSFGPMPPLVPSVVGVGAGGRDPDGHANVLRVVVGTSTYVEPVETPAPVEPAVVLEANVDDLDPRLWPGVLAALMDRGASDAWLTPILMKKGRPAHTLSVLCPPDLADALAELVLTHTTSIGLRRQRLDKLVLDREIVEVDVEGATVHVKLARLGGRVVTATPEFDDVARIARERGVPEKVVLAAAVRAASALVV